MRKIISIVMAMCMIFAVMIPAYAATEKTITTTTDNEVTSLINEITKTFNEKQYSDFISLTAGNLNSNLYDLILGAHSRQYEKDKIGFWNIDTLKVLKYKQIPNAKVPSSTVKYDDYTDYSNVITYYVSIDVTAKKDTSYIFTGTNYFIFVLGKDINSDYKLLQWSEANIKEMKNADLAYDDGTEVQQENIQDARLHGITLTGEQAKNYMSVKTLNDPDDCPIPSKIRVKLHESGEIDDDVNFYYYVKNVLPNEWTASTDPYESLKAGAMAVKMYGWYRCYNYKYYGQGFDVYDDARDQVYEPETEYSRSTQAINAVGGIGIINSDELIFETQYDAYSHNQGDGKMSQTGANDLAEDDYTWFEICDYYYSNSDKSSGDIDEFNYY